MSHINATRFLLFKQKYKQLHKAAFTEYMIKYNLNINQISVLLFLANNKSYDTLKEIVEMRGITKSQASISLEDLYNKNMVVKVQDQIDKRVFHFAITPDYKKLIRAMQLSQTEVFAKLFKGLTLEELSILDELTNKIFDNADKA